MDILKRQKLYRERTNNASTRKYEKTHNGFLMRVYRNMKSRIGGVQWKKAHLYKGKSLLSKEEFYKWSKESEDFLRLFQEWEKSDYPRKITPSVDRIDPTIGYEVGNMQWVTFSENCRRAGLTKKVQQ